MPWPVSQLCQSLEVFCMIINSKLYINGCPKKCVRYETSSECEISRQNGYTHIHTNIHYL